MFARDAEAATEREPRLKPEDPVTSLSADLQQSQAENVTDKDLLEGIKTTPALCNTASQQRVLRYVQKHEKLVPDQSAVCADSAESVGYHPRYC